MWNITYQRLTSAGWLEDRTSCRSGADYQNMLSFLGLHVRVFKDIQNVSVDGRSTTIGSGLDMPYQDPRL